jgi:phage protein D
VSPDLGIRLQVLAGATLPLPAPVDLVEALTAVEVQAGLEDHDTFRLTFTVGKGSSLEYGLLASGLLEPPNRLVLVTLFGAVPEVLIDGVITHQQLAPSNRPGDSALVVSGDDVTVGLTLRERSDGYPQEADSTIVGRILDRPEYARYGLSKDVTTTSSQPTTNEPHRTQQGTDLELVRELADRNGFVFYVEPTRPGSSVAYWGPENRRNAVQPPLSMNMGDATTVDRPMAFRYDALGPESPEVTVIDPVTGAAIPIPPPSLFGGPLASRRTVPLRTTELRDTASLSTAEAALRALAALTDSANAVTATGDLDAVRYGRLLRARRRVGVRGVGPSFDGEYLVQQVTSSIRRGAFTQSFALARDGLGSVTPRLPL